MVDTLIDAIPAVDLPTRLELGAPAFGDGPYSALRVNGAAWIREGGDDRFGEALESIEPLLSRSYLLGQPNLAGMGVGAWDLAVPTAADALVGAQTARIQRMVRGTQLADLFDEEEERRADDAGALVRGADLLAAMQTLDAAAEALDADAPDALREQLQTLRGDLSDRLRRERQHDPALDRLLRDADQTDPETVTRLRAESGTPAPEAPRAAVRAPRTADPYAAAVQGVLAQEIADPTPELAELRARIASTAESALAAPDGSKAALRLTERARRLLAEEVKLSGGAPTPGGAVDTAAIRAALAAKPTATPRPSGGPVRPRATLPEVPILSSRGPGAKVIGYLRVDEGTTALKRADGFVQVPVPGRTGPGWIAADQLAEPASTARGPQLEPAPMPAAPVRKAGRPDLGRFAMLVSQQTGTPFAELLAEVGEPVFAQARAERDAATEDAPRYHIDNVRIGGLEGADAASKAMQDALKRLPELLGRRAVDRQPTGQIAEVTVDLDVRVDGDLRAEADLIASRLADAITNSGGAEIGALNVAVQPRGGHHDAETSDVLLAQLANDDVDGIADRLVAERRTLDATQQARLARFFGDDFSDVMVFAGPMAGALAKSLDAEAVTHGQMVFFDPTHYRPDTAKGEALLAHELTHTRQADDRDVRAKEAEALAVESAYLSWIEPAGMSFAEEYALDPTTPSAAAAGDVASGMRAAAGRHVEKTAGARKDTAKFEQQVGQILDKVYQVLDQEQDFEGQRVGALLSRFVTW